MARFEVKIHLKEIACKCSSDRPTIQSMLVESEQLVNCLWHWSESDLSNILQSQPAVRQSVLPQSVAISAALSGASSPQSWLLLYGPEILHSIAACLSVIVRRAPDTG